MRKGAHMIHLFYRYIVLIILTGLLMGCTTAGKVVKVIANPSIQVGENDAQPSEIDLVLIGEDFINLNFDGDSTPVLIEVVQLRDDARFLAADYDSLLANLEGGVLAKTYLDHDEYWIKPSANQHVEKIEISPKTRYLGVIGHYADIDNVLWKKIIRINAFGEQSKILILAKENEIRVEKMKD